MNKSSLVVLILATVTLVFAQYSCSSDKLPASYDDVGICFETEILPMTVSNCAESGCHNPVDRADGYDFSSYDGIMEAVTPFNKNGSEFYESITETNLNDIMPPPPNTPLTAVQISLIAEWIDKGAPNTFDCFTACSVDTLITDSVAVSFTNHVLPILDVNCNNCHSGNTPDGGIKLTTWTEVKATVDDNSFLGTINHDGVFSPMPPNGKVDACGIRMIEEWVSAGALDN